MVWRDKSDFEHLKRCSRWAAALLWVLLAPAPVLAAEPAALAAGPAAKLKRLNPSELPSFDYLSQVVVVENGRKFAHIAGQTAINSDFNIVGDDLKSQMSVALVNLDRALAAADAERADVAKLTVYYVDLDGTAPRLVISGIANHFRDHGLPAVTYVGVSGLVAHGMLIEIEAIALLE